MSRLETWVILIAVGFATLVAAGCSRQPSSGTGVVPETAAASTIEVLVPCGQVGPFSEIVKLFEQANPGLKVEWVPENIVTITTKLLDGKAQPDLFLSMGDLEMDQVEQAGLVSEGTRTEYAENSLAIMVPAKNPAGVHTIDDLAKPSVKTITIPDPQHNSVGKHAQEALQRAALWQKVEKKLFFARFAADSKTAAAKGQAEASIGYYPCGVEVHVEGQEPAKPKNLKLVSQIPSDLYQPFGCEGAVLKNAKNPEGAKKLLAFLMRPESQEIFRKWEFVREAAASPVN